MRFGHRGQEAAAACPAAHPVVRPPRRQRKAKGRRMRKLLAVALSALVISGSCVWLATSTATSIAAVGNGTNSFQAGQMTLTDDDNGSALYTLGGYLDAGQQLPTKCIAVTYNGDWAGESFDGGPLTSWDPDKFWSNYPADVTISGGEITVLTATDATDVHLETHNLLNKNFQVELRKRSDSGQASIYLWKSGGNMISIIWSPFGVKFSITEQDQWQTVSLPYDGLTMKFVRMSSRGQDVRLQYSGDSLVWTTALEKTVGFDLNDVELEMQTARWSNDPPYDTAKFSAVTVTPHVGVRLMASATGDLAPYLNLTVERGTGGGFGSCTGFSPQATVYSGTLASMPTAYSDAAAAAGEWNPSMATQTVTYRISGYVTDSQAIAGKTANATFTWSAHAGD